MKEIKKQIEEIFNGELNKPIFQTNLVIDKLIALFETNQSDAEKKLAEVKIICSLRETKPGYLSDYEEGCVDGANDIRTQVWDILFKDSILSESEVQK